MATLTDALKNSLLDTIFNGTSFSVTTLNMSLHTADPSTDGSNEVTGGSYARQNVTSAFSASASGAVTNDTEISFTSMPATTVTHVGLWDNTTFIMGGALSASKTVGAGDTFKFPVGDFDQDIT